MRHNRMETVDWVAAVIIFSMFVLVVVALFAALANESNRIDAGVIVDKHYSPAYTTTTYQRVGDTTVPQNQYHPATYSFTIAGDKDGETVRYNFSVTESEYSAYKIGDYYKR